MLGSFSKTKQNRERNTVNEVLPEVRGFVLSALRQTAAATLTCLTLRVRHLRSARDSFVVHQRRAERRLVLQLLGKRLDAGLVAEALLILFRKSLRGHGQASSQHASIQSLSS